MRESELKDADSIGSDATRVGADEVLEGMDGGSEGAARGPSMSSMWLPSFRVVGPTVWL